MKEASVTEIGPIEYMIVAFPTSEARADVAPALQELRNDGLIRVIDVGFVSKDADGNITAEEAEDTESAAGHAFKAIEAEIGALLNEEDLASIAAELEPDSSAAVLVWEDLWATKLKSAIKNAGGVLLEIERIPGDVADAALAYARSGEQEDAS
jgi:hypothetical protein